MHRMRSFVVTVLIGLSGCSEGGPVEIDARDGPAIRMSGLGGRYAWSAANTGPANADVLAAIKETIDGELSRRGFGKADPADFFVEYHLLKENKTDSSVYPHGVVYPSGTLIIWLIDPSSRKIIWASSAQGRVLTNASPDERRSRISDVVRQMLDRMPPKTA